MGNATQASQRIAIVTVAFATSIQQPDSFAAVCATLIALTGTLQLLHAGAPGADTILVRSWCRGLLFAAAPTLLLVVAMIGTTIAPLLAIGGLLFYAVLAGYYESRIARIGVYMLERHSPAG
jgi:hypothetical protein